MDRVNDEHSFQMKTVTEYQIAIRDLENQLADANQARNALEMRTKRLEATNNSLQHTVNDISSQVNSRSRDREIDDF